MINNRKNVSCVDFSDMLETKLVSLKRLKKKRHMSENLKKLVQKEILQLYEKINYYEKGLDLMANYSDN
ncbi:MAG: hypothetical protein HC896_12075 [Bacteroidales bacterium]|nr:hypothetical protein [Bacteroidales bacterium]